MVEKIKQFYNPVLDRFNNFSLTVKGGKRYVPFSNLPIILTFGYPASNKEEALKNGGIVTTGKELYRVLAPEEIYQSKVSFYEPDERTGKYMDAVRNNIGLMRIEHGYDSFLPEDKVQVRYKPWMNLASDGVEVGKVEEQWIAEFAYRCDIDDYDIVSYFYSKKPSEKDIRTTRLIEEIESYFFRHGWNHNTFTCWECGRGDINWLDICGDIETKWDSFKEKYCGC